MNWNDWEAVWRRQEPPIGAAADIEKLKETFEAKRRKTAKALLARDILECSAGLGASAFFGLVWWQQGKTAWPIGFAIALMLGVSACFVRERIRAHRRQLGPDAPMLAKVEAEIAELRHQGRLLTRIWTWYLGPCAAAIALVWFAIVRSRPPWDPLRDPVIASGFGLFFAACLGFVWFLNVRAVRTQVNPRIEELEKLHRDLRVDQSD